MCLFIQIISKEGVLMFLKKNLIFSAVLALGFGSSAAFSKDDFAERVPGEIIVKFNSDKVDMGFLKSMGVMTIEPLGVSFGNFQKIELNDDKNFDMTLQALNDHPDVEYAEPNFVYRLIEPIVEDKADYLVDQIVGDLSEYLPDVPRMNELWGLVNTGQGVPGGGSSIEGADIDAMRAWALERGSHNVTIAVIDTGIDYNHQDLAANMWVNEDELHGTPGEDSDGNGFVDDIYGYDFTRNQGSPMDGNGHGTHCAGTIGAIHNNGLGVAGVMADVRMMGLKFLTDRGSGTTANAIRAVDYATMMDVDIMSNSWGGGGRSQALKDAIINANEAGILFVVAAGNSSSNNDTRPTYPASYNVDNVIAVAATTGMDGLASFSSFGAESVHLGAPGHQILSSTPNNNYRVLSGTSMAAPHVSGALGLLLSQEGRLPTSEVRERLIATTDPVGALRGRVANSGRLNAYNLLTDTRPDRNEPNPDAWETIVLDEVWETDHPYNNNEYEERVFHVEGAKFMRLRINRYDLEFRFDYLQVKNSNGEEVERITGIGEDYASQYVEGDTMTVVFQSDHTITRWGFLIEEIEVQYE